MGLKMSKQVLEVSYIIADAVKKLTENQPKVVTAEVVPVVEVKKDKKKSKSKKK